MFRKYFICFYVAGIFFSVTFFFCFVNTFLFLAAAVYSFATIVVIKTLSKHFRNSFYPFFSNEQEKCSNENFRKILP